MSDLSPHFSRAEFACPCCDVAKVDSALVELLERIRAAHYPGGLRIVSGYRCAARNRTVGGAPASQHLLGKAADITARITLEQARACGALGVGVQDATGLVVHVDVGPRRDWRYGPDGRVVA